ncbi:MAG: site-2 protease family protein [Candidatus Pacebacteria bacterium]|nr:site-2 protease family protein [Candidatus Paceibacterota bacterium]
MPDVFLSKIFLYVIIVFSAVFHEYLHAWTAYYLGDPTAKNSGRLTLNPIKHLDPIWTVLVPLFGLFFFNSFVGMAKPVPYNPYNLRDQKYGSIKVGISGPLANFAIAAIFGLVIRFFQIQGTPYLFLKLIVYVNIFLGLFNLIPVPPLDGSKILMFFFPRSRFLRFLEYSFLGIFLALAIAFMFLPPFADFSYFIITGRKF